MEYSKEKEEYGNDCMIYKKVIMTDIEDKYVVITLTRASGWVDNGVEIEKKEFDSYKEAKKYFDKI